jgi:hypothetical protein
LQDAKGNDVNLKNLQGGSHAYCECCFLMVFFFNSLLNYFIC